MHAEALAFVYSVLHALGKRRLVVEFGSRNVNGSARSAVEGTRWLGIDISPGEGVDLVADAATFLPPPEARYPDTVICCEVLEHAPDAFGLVLAAHRILAPGGVFVVTAAGDGRAPHSAVDGGELRPGEHYRNISERELRDWLLVFDRCHVEAHPERGDIYAAAWKAN